ncbi:MAG: Type IV pilus biogenesis and competence protein PilQ [Paracidovorax wautersii]|uniref:Type IV pilus biogenesis and competence protein PilQ n=1 Tax=Paracidovorax wautersii TaxID=1177982 RepID=A0A7V8FNX8_9BURK|nr:MAG: Type IV pilus biogenesis and competence protein PilQ [Paracidovorax wautersii]
MAEVPGVAGRAGTAGMPSVSAAAAGTPLRGIGFQSTGQGTGRIVVELPDEAMAFELRRQGQTLVLEFPGASLPEGLSRDMNVARAATPVQSIRSSVGDGRVRTVVEAVGAWGYTARQQGRELVVEIRPTSPAAPAVATPGPRAAEPVGSGERLSLNFQNIDVRALLPVLADFTGLNIVPSDSVAGELTLRLKNVPWEQALEVILQARHLGMRRSGSVLWIAPQDELLARERADLQAQAALRELEPLATRAYQLHYSRAADIAEQLAGRTGAGTGAGGTRLLTARGSAVAEPRTNQLFVSDVPSKLAEIEGLLQRLDKAMRQVLIEARIVVAEDTFSRTLGVRLGGGSRVGGHAALGSGYTAGSAGANPGDFVNLPAVSAAGSTAASFGLSLFNASATRFLNLELQALEEEGRGMVVSSPRVMTADQVKALIEQGTEVPYQEATSSGATSVSFRKANLKLEVTPQITPGGAVILELDVSKDTLGQETANGFAINTKHVRTQALVEDGGTIVIGGIFELSENETVRKVPLLGDLPGLGALFRSRSRSTAKTELLIFITPRVLEGGAALR